jgi:hypothetical protein
MVDESTLGLSLLTGVLIILFITWYRGVDPLVSSFFLSRALLSLLAPARAHIKIASP